MKIFQRHLARETLAATILVLAAFLALFAIFDLIEELKEIGRGNYQLQHALVYVLLCLPGRAYELMPVATLIGTLYALATLARHSEITVLRTSGLSTAGLLAALFRAGLLLAAFTFVFGEFVAPPAERLGQEIRMRAMETVVGQQFRSGVWLRDGTTFVNVREVLPDSRLVGVRIYDFDAGLRLRTLSEAAEGEYQPPGQWLLRDVVRSHLGERVRVERVAQMSWVSTLSPDILSVLMVVPERMAIPALLQYVRHLEQNRQKTQRYEIALWKKIVYPLATLVMMALALPFSYTHERVGAASLKIFLGVMIGIGFHMLNGLFSSLGVINDWPPFTSATAPSALFLLAAMGLLWWRERR